MTTKVLHPLDIGKKRFRALVDKGIEAVPQLPMVHTTDSYVLEDILDDGQVHPQDCKVFYGEKVTYLFYGRPAFRPNIDADPTGLKHYFPVCLILKPDFITKIRRVFPFDSGAFQRGFYGAYLHSLMKIGDFGLEPDPTTPAKLVSQFFGSVPAYLAARPEAVPKFDPTEFEAHSYSAMIHAKDGNAIDSRGSGIEVQTADHLSLADAVAAVILPSGFVDGVTGQRLKALGLDPLPYKTFERTRPSEYMSEITTICFNYYVRMGLITEQDF